MSQQLFLSRAHSAPPRPAPPPPPCPATGEYIDLSKFSRIYVVDLCKSLCEQVR